MARAYVLFSTPINPQAPALARLRQALDVLIQSGRELRLHLKSRNLADVPENIIGSFETSERELVAATECALNAFGLGML